MTYLYFKALHIIFVITWFAGLFYIVRLFIYHTETQDRPAEEARVLRPQFKIMESRLWYMITWPSAILTTITGLGMMHIFWPITDHPWLILKFFFIIALWIYHLRCGQLLKALKNDTYLKTSFGLRIWNEVSTVYLFAIVFLVVLKNSLSLVWGLVGLVIVSLMLMLGIHVYKKKRLKKS